MTDIRTQILAILNDPRVEMEPSVNTQALTGLLIELIRSLNDYNQCDFDCDNCHQGGCGNPTCDRGGCPEDNAARVDQLREGHTDLGCPICLTPMCRFLLLGKD